jgi:hypothetical protein
MANNAPDSGRVSEEVLTRWAESCLHMQHLGTLIQRELSSTGKNARVNDLAARVERRAWALFSELIEHGAKKPAGYREPDQE